MVWIELRRFDSLSLSLGRRLPSDPPPSLPAPFPCFTASPPCLFDQGWLQLSYTLEQVMALPLAVLEITDTQVCTLHATRCTYSAPVTDTHFALLTSDHERVPFGHVRTAGRLPSYLHESYR